MIMENAIKPIGCLTHFYVFYCDHPPRTPPKIFACRVAHCSASWNVWTQKFSGGVRGGRGFNFFSKVGTLDFDMSLVSVLRKNVIYAKETNDF